MTTGVRPGVHQFGLIFDDAAWPLLYVRFPSKPLSDEGFEGAGVGEVAVMGQS